MQHHFMVLFCQPEPLILLSQESTGAKVLGFELYSDIVREIPYISQMLPHSASLRVSMTGLGWQPHSAGMGMVVLYAHNIYHYNNLFMTKSFYEFEFLMLL